MDIDRSVLRNQFSNACANSAADKSSLVVFFLFAKCCMKEGIIETVITRSMLHNTYLVAISRKRRLKSGIIVEKYVEQLINSEVEKFQST